ncbi:MAG: DUF2207 domain-containing protein [Rhodoglobus sp.]
MRRLLQWTVLVALSAFSLLGVAGSASAAPGAPTPQADAAALVLPGDANDFTFQSFSADYYLGQDADGRSTLKTVETLVAVFPDFDQNHGILRALIDTYQGHPTDIQIVSVTDENGAPRDWHDATDNESSGDGDFHEIVIRDDNSGVFVHGVQTYVITYTQHNVTDFFADTNDDEFYWDTNGTGWQQPFGSVSATVHVPADLAGHLTGQSACYRGDEGATTPCDITSTEADGETLFTANADSIDPFENVTVSIGFDPHTFTARDDRYFASPLSFLQLFTVGGSVIAAVWALILRRTKLADGKGRPTIIAEYAPPKGDGIFTDAVVLQKTTRAAAASFIDLAVNGNIRIIETESTAWFSKKPVYTLQLLNGEGLDGGSWQVVTALFGYSPVVGAQYTMSSTDVTLSARVRAMVAAAKAGAVTGGWLKKVPFGTSFFPLAIAVLSVIGAVFFAIALGGLALGGVIPFLVVIPVVIAAFIVFSTAARKPLTDAGAELRDHLKGLELFIKVAEQDRIRVLQSPEGAERTPVATNDPAQVLKVYEKLLPYAVLFSLENRWAQELGKFYTDAAPDWYSGSSTFNAVLFASSISSISSTASSSYSGSSTSSSTGGSGGGGSSGGGGGGGGGGGV